MPLVMKKLSELKLAPYNPRKIGKKAKIGLAESIERFGLVQPIVWNKTTGNIVGGHQRYHILVEKKVESTEVYEVELSEEQEKALNIELNNPAIQGEWTERIEGLLQDIKKADNSLYDRLKFDDLEAELDRSAGINMSCPCCQYKWQFKNGQARVANQKDLEVLNDSKVDPVPPPTTQEQKEVQNIAAEMSATTPTPAKPENPDKAFDFSDDEESK